MLLPESAWAVHMGDFPWSRDLWTWNAIVSDYYAAPPNSLLNSGFGYYVNENGLGWVNRQGMGFYTFADRRWRMWHGQLDSVSRHAAQAYLQTLYEDFLSK